MLHLFRMERRVSADMAAQRGIALNQGLTGWLTATAALPLLYTTQTTTSTQHSQVQGKENKYMHVVCKENVMKCKFEMWCDNAMSGFTEFPFFSEQMEQSADMFRTEISR